MTTVYMTEVIKLNSDCREIEKQRLHIQPQLCPLDVCIILKSCITSNCIFMLQKVFYVYYNSQSLQGKRAPELLFRKRVYKSSDHAPFHCHNRLRGRLWFPESKNIRTVFLSQNSTNTITKKLHIFQISSDLD